MIINAVQTYCLDENTKHLAFTSLVIFFDVCKIYRLHNWHPVSLKCNNPNIRKASEEYLTSTIQVLSVVGKFKALARYPTASVIEVH